jgi:hypothetical protein
VYSVHISSITAKLSMSRSTSGWVMQSHHKQHRRSLRTTVFRGRARCRSDRRRRFIHDMRRSAKDPETENKTPKGPRSLPNLSLPSSSSSLASRAGPPAPVGVQHPVPLGVLGGDAGAVGQLPLVSSTGVDVMYSGDG